ncbi:MAG: cadherin-like beta sandwich domain-containing protein [Velocimicrobium sp.]
MKFIKKVVFSLMTLCLVLLINDQRVYAAAGTLSFSDPSVTLGSEVSVTVKVSTTDDTMLGGVDLTLAYDASALEFVSGTSASGSAGTIRIAGVIDNATTTSLSYTLTFNTLKASTSSITVASYEIISLDYEPISISKAGNSTVTIEEKEEVKTSSDCNLASLEISPGTLSPAFSPTTVKYSATVDYETTKIAVSGTPNDSKASVTGVKGTDLSVGSNTVRVVVTAENGVSVAYVINVTREAQAKEAASVDNSSQTDETDDTTESQDQADAVEILIGDMTYRVVLDIPEEIIPEGFEAYSYTYKDAEVNVLKSEESGMILFYLEGEDETSFYLYEEENDSFIKYIPISFEASLIILEFDDSIVIPEGFTQESLTINETPVTAYKSNQNSDFYLIYGRNIAGEKALYLYDTVENFIQRYVEDSAEEEQESVEVDSAAIADSENQLQELTSSYNLKLQNRMIMLYVFAVIMAILLIIIILLILKIQSTKRKKSIKKGDTTDDLKKNNKHKKKKSVDNNDETIAQQKKSEQSKAKQVIQKEESQIAEDEIQGDEFEITFIDLNEDEKK